MKKLLKNVYLALRTFLLARAGAFLWPAERADAFTLPRKILFIRIDRLGDMALSTPAFKAIKEKFPSSELCVLAAPFPAGLIEGDPSVDKIYLWEPGKGVSALVRRILELRRSGFDLAIDPYFGPELKTALIAFLSGAPFRAGYDINGRGIFFNIRAREDLCRSHFAEEAFGVLKAVGISRGAGVPELFITPGSEVEARGILERSGVGPKDPLISVHAGGYYPSQRWPAERFAGVIETLTAAHKARIMLIGSSSEAGVTEAVFSALGEQAKSRVFKAVDLKPGTLCALIRRSKLFIGNNSGPLHLAAALKVPSVSTMGPTDPVKWTPLGADQVVLRTSLPCAGCGKGRCGTGCMLDITVSAVLEAADKFIARR